MKDPNESTPQTEFLKVSLEKKKMFLILELSLCYVFYLTFSTMTIYNYKLHFR